MKKPKAKKRPHVARSNPWFSPPALQYVARLNPPKRYYCEECSAIFDGHGHLCEACRSGRFVANNPYRFSEPQPNPAAAWHPGGGMSMGGEYHPGSGRFHHHRRPRHEYDHGAGRWYGGQWYPGGGHYESNPADLYGDWDHNPADLYGQWPAHPAANPYRFSEPRPNPGSWHPGGGMSVGREYHPGSGRYHHHRRPRHEYDHGAGRWYGGQWYPGGGHYESNPGCKTVDNGAALECWYSNPGERREDVLCSCGWGRLRCPVSQIPDYCPVCNAAVGVCEDCGQRREGCECGSVGNPGSYANLASMNPTITHCGPCSRHQHARCQRGQAALGGDCDCWCQRDRDRPGRHPLTEASYRQGLEDGEVCEGDEEVYEQNPPHWLLGPGAPSSREDLERQLLAGHTTLRDRVRAEARAGVRGPAHDELERYADAHVREARSWRSDFGTGADWKRSPYRLSDANPHVEQNPWSAPLAAAGGFAAGVAFADPARAALGLGTAYARAHARRVETASNPPVESNGCYGVHFHGDPPPGLFEAAHGRTAKANPFGDDLDEITVRGRSVPVTYSKGGRYHRARVADPDEFSQIRTKTLSESKGIKALVGRHTGKAGPRGGRTEIQSYLFDATRYTPQNAVRWLEGHSTPTPLMIDVAPVEATNRRLAVSGSAPERTRTARPKVKKKVASRKKREAAVAAGKKKPARTVPPNDRRCTDTSSGSRCKGWTVTGKTICGLHAGGFMKTARSAARRGKKVG